MLHEKKFFCHHCCILIIFWMFSLTNFRCCQLMIFPGLNGTQYTTAFHSIAIHTGSFANFDYHLRIVLHSQKNFHSIFLLHIALKRDSNRNLLSIIIISWKQPFSMLPWWIAFYVILPTGQFFSWFLLVCVFLISCSVQFCV